jgi:hypothetical protein
MQCKLFYEVLKPCIEIDWNLVELVEYCNYLSRDVNRGTEIKSPLVGVRVKGSGHYRCSGTRSRLRIRPPGLAGPLELKTQTQAAYHFPTSRDHFKLRLALFQDHFTFTVTI